MSGRRVNLQRVKIHWNYTARDLANCLGVHKNTIRNWQRNGLTPIDGQRPFLFQGTTVRAFLDSWNKRWKRPCPTGMLFCFRCREPQLPKPTSVAYLPVRSGRPGNLRAVCAKCGTVMHRRVKQSVIPAVLPGLLVQIMEAAPRLNGSSSPSLICDFERQTTA